jgi:hypothetical protein
VVYLKNRDVPGVVERRHILGEGGANIETSRRRGDGSARPPSSRSLLLQGDARPPAAPGRRGSARGDLGVDCASSPLSVLSTRSRAYPLTIVRALDPGKYEVVPIAVGPDGHFRAAVPSAKLLAEAGP